MSFLAILSFFRLHTFLYTKKTKTIEAFILCTLDVLNSICETANHIKTDIMSAVALISNGTKHKNVKILNLKKI